MSIRWCAVLCGIGTVLLSALDEEFGVAIFIVFTGMFAHLAGKVEGEKKP